MPKEKQVYYQNLYGYGFDMNNNFQVFGMNMMPMDAAGAIDIKHKAMVPNVLKRGNLP